MQAQVLKEIKIKLPVAVADAFPERDIIKLMLDISLNKTDFYGSRCKQFEALSKGSFAAVSKRIQKKKREDFKGWDDLLVWEGYEIGREEWARKYRELKRCLK